MLFSVFKEIMKHMSFGHIKTPFPAGSATAAEINVTTPASAPWKHSSAIFFLVCNIFVFFCIYLVIVFQASRIFLAVAFSKSNRMA